MAKKPNGQNRHGDDEEAQAPGIAVGCRFLAWDVERAWNLDAHEGDYRRER